MSRTWQDYLDEGYTVVMDNDRWWFVDYEGDGVWERGGDGPYGVDLLKYLLDKHYSGMEWV
jgi:hypothetical protein